MLGINQLGYTQTCGTLTSYNEGQTTFRLSAHPKNARKMRHSVHSDYALWNARTLATCLALVFCPLIGLSADSKSNTSGMLLPQTESNYQVRPYQGKLEADDGQWVRPAKDYASTRYSTLDQINSSNVQNLKLAFSFSTGLTRGHEAAPLVVNNTMYIVTPWPNKLYALDLTKPGAPMKWVYQPMPTQASQGIA